MYENIGKKIKSLASILTWIGIIAYVIAALILIIVGISEDEVLLIFGIVTLIVGPFVTWISNFFVYGFGELIDKVTDIERNMRGGQVKSVAQSKVDTERINRIERLRSQGLITEEEYQQAISKEI